MAYMHGICLNTQIVVIVFMFKHVVRRKFIKLPFTFTEIKKELKSRSDKLRKVVWSIRLFNFILKILPFRNVQRNFSHSLSPISFRLQLSVIAWSC